MSNFKEIPMESFGARPKCPKCLAPVAAVRDMDENFARNVLVASCLKCGNFEISRASLQANDTTGSR